MMDIRIIMKSYHIIISDYITDHTIYDVIQNTPSGYSNTCDRAAENLVLLSGWASSRKQIAAIYQVWVNIKGKERLFHSMLLFNIICVPAFSPTLLLIHHFHIYIHIHFYNIIYQSRIYANKLHILQQIIYLFNTQYFGSKNNIFWTVNVNTVFWICRGKKHSGHKSLE